MFPKYTRAHLPLRLSARLRRGRDVVFVALVLHFFVTGAATAAESRQSITVIAGDAETAGIDGRDWNATYPGATTFDAVHRAVLVRFPDIAQTLKPHLDAARRIARVELHLDYASHETAPEGYLVREALGRSKWEQDPPRWHVVAWALRRPWIADREAGPSFNAHVKGAGHWTRYGAGDLKDDRYASRFGPAELSVYARRARIDITALVTSDRFGSGLVERIGVLRDHGFLIQKLETYDSRYREAGNAYEWAMPVGGHGIRFRNARLEFTMVPSETRIEGLSLAPAVTVAALKDMVARSETGRTPTATLPANHAFRRLAAKLALDRQRPSSAWQRARLAELQRIGGGRASAWSHAVEARDHKRYELLIREILATPPRYWQGWDIADDLLVWNLYRELLPPPVQDHVKAYWAAWLMPDIPTRDLVHPQSQEAIDYFLKTGDWRGRASFFRDGYNYTTSTQNFNHTAAMGALLGGAVIDSERAIEDGRHGLEHFPLRLWAMRDGTVQEMLDHYYLSITLSAQKMFADFGPSAADRLMGRIMVDRTLELLTAAYHPRLRRLISASGRARLPGLLVEQDGVYGVLHTLSRKGVLNYLDQPLDSRVHGMPVWGRDFPPGRVAVQAITSAWADEWATRAIDDKTLPFEETSADMMRGAFDTPLWRRTYLGRHYGLASQDLRGGTFDVVAQWQHTPGTVTAIEDLSTLTMRYVANEHDMAATSGGTVPHAGGIVTFQHRNRAIVCTKPHSSSKQLTAIAGTDGLWSLASVIAFWNFRPSPDWEILVDGDRIASLPAETRAGAVITIKDGVSYIGIIPLPATDLGRSAEVVIGFGGAGKTEPDGTRVKPALTITSYNLKRSTGTAPTSAEWSRIVYQTLGGYVVELGDVSEHGSFEAFVRHMRSTALTVRASTSPEVVHVRYRSGKDVMEIGCGTAYTQPQAHYPIVPRDHGKAIVYRRINGRWPYLAKGIDRDTPLMQSGTSGKLEKNGATLSSEPGRKAFLQTEPVTGTYLAYNPLPDPTDWTLTVPGGIKLAADGKVGLLRVEVQPRRRRLSIDYAPKPEQNGREMARHLLVSGFAQSPVVELNGATLTGPFARVRRAGSIAYAVPITR